MKENQPASYKPARLVLALAFLFTLLCFSAEQPAVLAQKIEPGPAVSTSALAGLEFVSKFGGEIYKSGMVHKVVKW